MSELHELEECIAELMLENKDMRDMIFTYMRQELDLQEAKQEIRKLKKLLKELQ